MLKTRVITALLLLGALLMALFGLPPYGVSIAFGAVAALAAWEWAGLMRQGQAARVMYAFVVSLFCWQTWVIADNAYLLFWSLAALFWLGVALPWLRAGWRLAGNDFVAYALGLVLIVATWAALVFLQVRGAWSLLAVLALAPAADIAAYFAGRAWGRRKLAPRISPGKTWEGVLGGVLGMSAYGLVVAASGAHLTGWASWLGLAAALVVLALMSVVGDLFESLLKRQAGLKDSSALLPGHGGILDRIDSQMALLPLAALLLYWSGV